MTHQEVIEKDIVGEYARNRLPPDERRAFQEHFFECDECFGRAQLESRFGADVRRAAAAGALPAREPSWGAGWLRPVWAFSLTAAVALAGALVWLYAARGGSQGGEQAGRASQGAAQPGAETQPTAKADARQGEEVQQQPPPREGQAANTGPEPRRGETEGARPQRTPDRGLIARADVPSVTLESTRDSADVAELAVPAGAGKVSLLIPVEAGGRFKNFAVDVSTRGRVPVATVSGLRPGRSGTLSASVPAARFAPGDYRVRLYGTTASGRELLAEYDLRVTKK